MYKSYADVLESYMIAEEGFIDIVKKSTQAIINFIKTLIEKLGQLLSKIKGAPKEKAQDIEYSDRIFSILLNASKNIRLNTESATKLHFMASRRIDEINSVSDKISKDLSDLNNNLKIVDDELSAGKKISPEKYRQLEPEIDGMLRGANTMLKMVSNMERIQREDSGDPDNISALKKVISILTSLVKAANSINERMNRAI